MFFFKVTLVVQIAWIVGSDAARKIIIIARLFIIAHSVVNYAQLHIGNKSRAVAIDKSSAADILRESRRCFIPEY